MVYDCEDDDPAAFADYPPHMDRYAVMVDMMRQILDTNDLSIGTIKLVASGVNLKLSKG